MLESTPVQGVDAHIVGSSNYEDTKDSDIVVITAGIARKPGMSRDDLVSTNANIMKAVTREVVNYSPNCYIIVLTRGFIFICRLGPWLNGSWCSKLVSLSWCSEHGARIENIREASKRTGKNVAILLDTKGPEIRTQTLENGVAEFTTA